MAVEELDVVRLRNDFYRDGFYKVILALLTISLSTLFLLALSFYIHFNKPPPVTFKADNEWRILGPVPLDQPYLITADLAQWVTEALPKVFTFDFVNYTKNLKSYMHYFTSNGWNKYLEKVNEHANFTTVNSSKMFINAYPAGAPFVINQGLLGDKYGWWVQMPINVQYITLDRNYTVPLVFQLLVVRVPTLNNLYGVGIENMIVSQGSGDQINFNV